MTVSNVEYLLSKLDGITRTFGHEASMPQGRATVLPHQISN